MTNKILGQNWAVLLAGLVLVGGANQTFAGGGGGGGGGRGGGAAAGGGGGGARAGGAAAGSTRDYPNSTMMGTVQATYDPETGQLIVITDDRTFNSVNAVVSGMDQPKPQVLIKVVFLEVSYDKALDFGVEGTYNHQFNSAGLLTNVAANLAGGISTNFANQNPVVNAQNNFLLSQQGTAGSLIGGNTMPSGAGLYSVLGNDYTATIRAISSGVKTEVLSRPSILVRNNQPATITVGQSIPLVSSVTYNTVNNLPITTIGYRDVGIILQVTPFIKPDGLVQMIVAPQISSLSSQTVPIAAGFNAPAIDLRSASTVVVVPNGQTVIIGGLMQNGKAAIDTKIPILGDIPLLGLLFKRTQRDHTKKELMIFLTPQVVEMPGDLASMSSTEAQKSDMAPKAFSEKDYDQMLDSKVFKKPAKAAAGETIK